MFERLHAAPWPLQAPAGGAVGRFPGLPPSALGSLRESADLLCLAALYVRSVGGCLSCPLARAKPLLGRPRWRIEGPGGITPGSQGTACSGLPSPGPSLDMLPRTDLRVPCSPGGCRTRGAESLRVWREPVQGQSFSIPSPCAGGGALGPELGAGAGVRAQAKGCISCLRWVSTEGSPPGEPGGELAPWLKRAPPCLQPEFPGAVSPGVRVAGWRAPQESRRKTTTRWLLRGTFGQAGSPPRATASGVWLGGLWVTFCCTFHPRVRW